MGLRYNLTLVMNYKCISGPLLIMYICILFHSPFLPLFYSVLSGQIHCCLGLRFSFSFIYYTITTLSFTVFMQDPDWLLVLQYWLLQHWLKWLIWRTTAVN